MYLGNLILDIMLLVIILPSLLYLLVYGAVCAYMQAGHDMMTKFSREHERFMMGRREEAFRNNSEGMN